MGTNNIAPVSQPRNLPADRPISSRRLNLIFDEALRDLVEIFHTALPSVSSLKSALDLSNGRHFHGIETIDKLVRGGSGGLEQGDHTEDWRKI